MTSEVFKHDGPYSWLILLTIILSNFSSFGFMMGTLGPMSDLFPDLFGEDQSKTNVISSVAGTVLSITIPIATLVMKVVGCRVIAAVGALLTLIGMISAAFVTQIWQLVVAYSVVAIVGISLIFTSTIGVIPHYFKRRQDAAYTGLGLGVGIAYTVYPFITAHAFSTFGYKYGMLCLLPVFIFSIAAPFIFIPQVASEKPESFRELMSSYARTVKHFVTPFYLLNATLIIGTRPGLAINLFSYLSGHFGEPVAVISYTIHGVSFLGAMIFFTLYGLKFKGNYFIFFIITCFVFGIAICVIPLVHSAIAVYFLSVILGACFGITFGFKGNVVAHIFPPQDITYLYGLTEFIGGIGAFVIPMTAGYIDSIFDHGQGFYFTGACCAVGGISLLLPALLRPKLWQPYTKRKPELTQKPTSVQSSELECGPKLEREGK